MDEERRDTRQQASDASDTEVAMQIPWFDQAKFLTIDRQLFDPKTDQLNRQHLSTILPSRSGRHFFDLCTTTLTMLQRLYMNLLLVWANNHTALRTNVRLTEMQRKFRLFHQYSLDTVRKALFAATDNNESDDTAATKTFRREKDRLARELDDSMRQLAEINERIVTVNEQLDATRADLIDLRRRMETIDSGHYYLTRLYETKQLRLQVLETEAENLRLWLRDGKYESYTRNFEDRLVTTLNDSIYQIVRLREQLQRTPELLSGRAQNAIVGGVVGRMPFANLPNVLMPLYLRLYRNLTEASVRQVLSQRFGI